MYGFSSSSRSAGEESANMSVHMIAPLVYDNEVFILLILTQMDVFVVTLILKVVLHAHMIIHCSSRL